MNRAVLACVMIVAILAVVYVLTRPTVVPPANHITIITTTPSP